MRFSLRVITSGACKSINCCRRLLRLITRRYKSFRSDVANRPPSNGTIGRRSGGITGIVVITIHSGRIEFFARLFNNLIRRTRRSLRVPTTVSNAFSNCVMSVVVLMSFSSVKIASAPMPASKTWPYFNERSRYTVSERIESGVSSFNSVSAMCTASSSSRKRSSFCSFARMMASLRSGVSGVDCNSCTCRANSPSICLRFTRASSASCSIIAVRIFSSTRRIMKLAK